MYDKRCIAGVGRASIQSYRWQSQILNFTLLPAAPACIHPAQAGLFIGLDHSTALGERAGAWCEGALIFAAGPELMMRPAVPDVCRLLKGAIASIMILIPAIALSTSLSTRATSVFINFCSS